jgi:stress response protein YsnF
MHGGSRLGVFTADTPWSKDRPRPSRNGLWIFTKKTRRFGILIGPQSCTSLLATTKRMTHGRGKSFRGTFSTNRRRPSPRQITSQVPDQRIAWKSIDGSPNSGTITFDELGDDLTRVNATIGYEPEGFLEKTGDALGFPSGRIEGDLQRFRDYVEERGRETGGWRGKIGEEEKSDSETLPTPGSRLEGETDQPFAAKHEVSETNVSAQPRDTVDERTIEVPLSEEEVRVGKRTVGAGEVKLHKTVTTEQVNVPVELKREDIVVERVSAHEVDSTGKEPFKEELVKIP